MIFGRDGNIDRRHWMVNAVEKKVLLRLVF